MQTTLGWRRMVGVIAIVGAVLVAFDYLTGAEWAAMVVKLVVGS